MKRWTVWGTALAFVEADTEEEAISKAEDTYGRLLPEITWESADTKYFVEGE